MTAFTIDSQNQIGTCGCSPEETTAALDTDRFATEEEWASLAQHWPTSRLLDIWNRLPGQQPVRRFTDRPTALRRLWAAFEALSSGASRKAARSSGGGQRTRKQRCAPPRENTKAARILSLLRQPQGASLEVLMAETGWQAHSIRGFLSAQLGKKLGLKVRSARQQGVRVYSLKS